MVIGTEKRMQVGQSSVHLMEKTGFHFIVLSTFEGAMIYPAVKIFYKEFGKRRNVRLSKLKKLLTVFVTEKIVRVLS